MTGLKKSAINAVSNTCIKETIRVIIINDNTKNRDNLTNQKTDSLLLENRQQSQHGINTVKGPYYHSSGTQKRRYYFTEAPLSGGKQHMQAMVQRPQSTSSVSSLLCCASSSN